MIFLWGFFDAAHAKLAVKAPSARLLAIGVAIRA